MWCNTSNPNVKRSCPALWRVIRCFLVIERLHLKRKYAQQIVIPNLSVSENGNDYKFFFQFSVSFSDSKMSPTRPISGRYENHFFMLDYQIFGQAFVTISFVMMERSSSEPGVYFVIRGRPKFSLELRTATFWNRLLMDLS